jgi:hypothetical protein
MASKIIVDQLEKTGGALTALTLPVANATVGQYMKNDGSGVLGWVDPPADVSGFHNVKFVTATDTSVDLESGTIKILVEVLGAGGCSGGNDGGGYSGGCGGAGGYSMQQLTVVDSDTWNVTIGAGGVDAATRNGGDTVFAQQTGTSLGSTITGGGGVGALDPPGSAYGSGGAGGTVTNANTGNKLNIVGATGEHGYGGKAGRDSRWGFGGCRGTTTTGAGGNATGYGASGGDASGVNTLGGEGGDGLVIIWEYK